MSSCLAKMRQSVRHPYYASRTSARLTVRLAQGRQRPETPATPRSSAAAAAETILTALGAAVLACRPHEAGEHHDDDGGRDDSGDDSGAHRVRRTRRRIASTPERCCDAPGRPRFTPSSRIQGRGERGTTRSGALSGATSVCRRPRRSRRTSSRAVRRALRLGGRRPGKRMDLGCDSYSPCTACQREEWRPQGGEVR